MILLVKHAGNHSNRLFQNIHFEAFALENKLIFLNTTFNDFRKIFNLNIFFHNKFLSRFIKKIIRMFGFRVLNFTDQFYDTSQPDFSILKNSLVFVEGWSFRVDYLTEKYKNHFQNKYSISDNCIRRYRYRSINNYSKISEKIDQSEICIGIHIRRGDYKEWLGGIHYYDDRVYINAMNAVKELFPNKKIQYIMFSNEKISLNDSENVIISKNEWYIDHYLMSKCDYLIGPPSTFTM